MKTPEEIEFEKFMKVQVVKLKAEHRAFMWRMAPRLIAIALLLAALVAWEILK